MWERALVAVFATIVGCDYAPLPKLASGDGGMSDGMKNGDGIVAAPVVSGINIAPRVAPGATVAVECEASDADGDTLSYTWTFSGGTSSGSGATVMWTTPATEGRATITCAASDGNSMDSAMTNVQIIVTNGLVAGYLFNGNGADFSGTGHDVTVPANMAFVADRFGQVGNALRFNGVDNFIAVPSEADFDLVTLSIVTFIKPTASTNNRGVLGKGTSNGGGAFSLRLLKEDGSTMAGYGQFMWTPSGTAGYSAFTTAAIPVSQYASFIAVRTTTDARLYVGGTLVTSQTHAGAVAATNDAVTIGKDGVTIPGYFYGDIDEVRFYNRALTAAEIQAIAGGTALE